VVLDQDPTAVTPKVLLETHVLRTVVGGKTVFLAPAVKSLAEAGPVTE
jgi:predicted amidohydrolase YtcJ